MDEMEIDQTKLIDVVNRLFDFFQANEVDELLAYMAMIHLTKALEEKHGFGHEQKQDA